MIKKFDVYINKKKYTFNVNEHKEKEFLAEYGNNKPNFVGKVFSDKVKKIVESKNEKERSKNSNFYDPNDPDKLFS